MMEQKIITEITSYLSQIDTVKEKVLAINNIRLAIHNCSPFKNEPVDLVTWVPSGNVEANDYNPNKVAPPEMELLEVSITNDGYTQPVVTFPTETKEGLRYEVVDGFHRTRVAKESIVVSDRVMGYVPTVAIRTATQNKADRIASTIRHNRARGKHQVNAMSEIVIDLKNRNWTNTRIAFQLGMDEDEILRLCQISGLEDLFKDNDFGKAWVSIDSIDEFEAITDKLTLEEIGSTRTANTNDDSRIFHTYDKWECVDYGLYMSGHAKLSHDECNQKYIDVLGSPETFADALESVIVEWKNSCEHYLTNKAMNRIAWLGQAAVAYLHNVPSKYASAWMMLTEEQQDNANNVALAYLNKWLVSNGLEEVGMETAQSKGRQNEIY